MRLGSGTAALCAALIAVAWAAAGAAPAGAQVSLLQIGTFALPTYVTAPQGDVDRVFVVQKGGRIAMVKGGVSTTFLDITSKVKSSGDEQGLLSMAFAADYATSGTFYVYYTAPPASGSTGSDLTIEAYQRAEADHGDPASARLVLSIPHRMFDNHNGGQLQVGGDGMLWIGTGDGGNGNDTLGNAQKTDPSWNDAGAGHDARLGKILRVDPRPGDGCDGRCTIPAGNPGFAQPEKSHGAPDGFASIAGGYVVRDQALPDLLGRYVYADTYAGDIRAVTLGPGGATGDAATGLHVSTLSSFGEDACGRVYAVSLDGPVYRLAQSGACVPPVVIGAPGVALPPAAGGGGGTQAPPATVDRAPVVKLRAASRQRPWRTGVVRVRASCDEICTVGAQGTFLVTRTRSGAGAAVVKLLRTARAKQARLAAGATVTVKMKVSARTRRSLLAALKRGRRVTLRVAVTATDRTGHARHASARSRITRR